MKSKLMKRTLVIGSIFMFLLSITSYAFIEGGFFNLSRGVEYIDKTFVYEMINHQTNESVYTLCAQKDAPTYDSKKGLMTWVDYSVYQLEEQFTVSASGHIRAILEVAGPQLNQEDVVNKLKATTGIEELTYEEVVSAMQYAIWYYTDNDFTIPSTSNGEDLYRYFVTLPEVPNSFEDDVVQIFTDKVERDKQSEKIIIEFHYTGLKKANIQHSYSKDIIEVYGAVENIVYDGNRTNVSLEIPIVEEEFEINFQVTVKGTLKTFQQALAFAPEVDKSAQKQVGVKPIKSFAVVPKSAAFSYLSYQLTLDDDGDVTKNGFRSGTYISINEMNELNQVGKDGYKFIGWFNEDNVVVTEGVTMNRNRYLHAVYEMNESRDKDSSSKEETPVEEDSTKDRTSNKEDVPKDSEEETNLDNPDIPSGLDKPDDTENIPDGKLPFDITGFIPKTGGVPLLIFMVAGSVTLSIGILLKRMR